ncbi:DEAD/DEAH box helicase [Streptococcus suis]|uniref:DEAD/DEAH box helicase n=1 Tax=Streptococcus suis TaxID=1307 RepID=UPI001C957A62|nr:DEAD/DEAH box helicase family protein [Streptococcus suis]MBY5010326.1 DEAD/DEAH box helicase family protein [Streptococcus suis]
MNNRFPQYTTDYISGVMSLRTPQRDSLKILEEIMNSIHIQKGMNLKAALESVNTLYPICTDFERDFMSLTFALATGVGKTRLMGAFIAYFYTQHNVKNFFVVAPNTTIYEKLKKDLSDFNHSKYVFKGLGCFLNPPQIVTDDDYKSKQISMFESDIRIFVFNIDKFNKDEANMRKLNEMIGDSFYQYLASLPDLVLIMDESHHYRADKGIQALNDLKPMLGVELTATPLVGKGKKQEKFKNVVYEYPLSKAIEDGYTRTPYAATRSDIDFFNFGVEELDKTMLYDGVKLHERTKLELETYAINNSTEENPIRTVKPFMMVVCKDTDHAKWVETFVTSDEFRDGIYRNKTITVHSKKTGAESEANNKLLLEIERSDNPIEIVIHVNMLKEGWDVNNLYTIVPLRTAASKILREQMVGRGLRLPYGKRTGDSIVDAVYLTAHDKFQEIIEEAQQGDSIFKAGNIITIEDIETKTSTTQLSFEFEKNDIRENAYKSLNITRTDSIDKVIDKTSELVQTELAKEIQEKKTVNLTSEQMRSVVDRIKEKVNGDKDLGEVYRENENPFSHWLDKNIEEVHQQAINKFIPIPRLKVTDKGVEEYGFADFDLDLATFTHTPINNELVIQNLANLSDLERLSSDAINFDGYNPKKALLEILREKPEIDYEKCSDLLFKLITQVCDHYENKYSSNIMRNIIMMFKKDIAQKIYSQMLLEDHFYTTNGCLEESVSGTSSCNISQSYTWTEHVDFYSDSYESGIKSVLFEGIKKGVFSTTKFDSKPELILARVLEHDTTVQNWLRPAPAEFNITYNRGKRYEPDFVVETKESFYLIEVKGEDKLENADVIAKSMRAVQFCDVATNWAMANGRKPWKYLFIPSQQIQASSSFTNLAERYGKVVDKSEKEY